MIVLWSAKVTFKHSQHSAVVDFFPSHGFFAAKRQKVIVRVSDRDCDILAKTYEPRSCVRARAHTYIQYLQFAAQIASICLRRLQSYYICTQCVRILFSSMVLVQFVPRLLLLLLRLRFKQQTSDIFATYLISAAENDTVIRNRLTALLFAL